MEKLSDAVRQEVLNFFKKERKELCVSAKGMFKKARFRLYVFAYELLGELIENERLKLNSKD